MVGLHTWSSSHELLPGGYVLMSGSMREHVGLYPMAALTSKGETLEHGACCSPSMSCPGQG
jgi:hypothetical protein